MQVVQTNDARYPFYITDGWGGRIYLSEENLKKLQKEIEKALDK